MASAFPIGPFRELAETTKPAQEELLLIVEQSGQIETEETAASSDFLGESGFTLERLLNVTIAASESFELQVSQKCDTRAARAFFDSRSVDQARRRRSRDTRRRQLPPRREVSPAVGKEEEQQRYLGLQLKESARQVTAVCVARILEAAHLEHGADDVEAVAHVVQRLCLVIGIVGELRKVVDDHVPEFVLVLTLRPPAASAANHGVESKPSRPPSYCSSPRALQIADASSSVSSARGNRGREPCLYGQLVFLPALKGELIFLLPPLSASDRHSIDTIVQDFEARPLPPVPVAGGD